MFPGPDIPPTVILESVVLFLRYCTVRVVLLGAIPNLLFDNNFVGSKLVSAIYFLPYKLKLTFEGSTTSSESTSASEPKPNCKKVLLSSFSTTNLLGTITGFNNSFTSCLSSPGFGTPLNTESCVKFSTS